MRLLPFTALLCALFLLMVACAPAHRKTTPDAGLELRLLHVNDTHAFLAGIDEHMNACFEAADCRGGLARISAAIQTARQEQDNVIALDAGDQFQGTLFYSVNKWPVIAAVDALLPYDAMTLGNHEFDEGCRELARFLEAQPLPVLAANLTPQQGCPLAGSRIRPYLVRTVRGTRVGIIGLDLYARRSAREAAALHHSLSVVFQDYTSSANPRFRVEHIIGESLRALERSTGQRVDRRARICELLEQVGLPATFISRYPHELSGGQLQRVCIARALAIRPRIILLDEAISSLDASTQVQIMDLLIELRRDLGLSYLFITHDLTSITYLCDRVVFIDAGTIVEQVDDIRCIAMIRNDYARNLLGSVMGIGVEHGSGAARTGQDRYAAIA